MYRPGNTIALLASLIAGAAASFISPSAYAHPLGNDSVTQFNILYLCEDRIEVEYFVVFAEVPTVQILSDIDADRDGSESPAESRKWSRDTIDRLIAGGLELKLNDRNLNLELRQQVQDDGKPADWYSLSKQPSEISGLWHIYFMVRLSAAWPRDALRRTNSLTFQDRSYPDTFGLKRVLLDFTEGQSEKIEFITKDRSLVSEEENPFAYEVYNPLDLPIERSASVQFRIVGWTPPFRPADTQPDVSRTSSAPLAGVRDERIEQRFQASRTGADRPAYFRHFTRDLLTFWTLLLGTLSAFIYGAVHALLPGHAKTAVAAYLISQHGSYRHAVVLAATVTFTHVFFVVLMGLVILRIGAAAGQALQLWLGLASGLMIAAMGGWLIARATSGSIGRRHQDPDHHHYHSEDLPESATGWFRRLISHSHPHLHPATHSHVPHDHEGHAHAHSHPRDASRPHPHAPTAQITARQIVLLGIAGGMVPCPAAILIMLAMVGLNRVSLGLYIIGVFSLGLALMLMIVGTLALASRRIAAAILRSETTDPLESRSGFVLTRLLPACSGTVVAAFGSLIALHYAFLLATGRPLVAWLT